MGNVDEMGLRIGMFCVALAIGDLTGPPVSGAINTATGGYIAVGFYAGELPFALTCDRAHSALYAYRLSNDGGRRLTDLD